MCYCCPALIPSLLSNCAFFAPIMPHTLRVSTLKDVTINWIPCVTFSFITWQGEDLKRVQFLVFSVSRY